MAIISVIAAVEAVLSDGAAAGAVTASILVCTATAASLAIDGLSFNCGKKEVKLFAKSKDLIKSCIDSIKAYMTFNQLESIATTYLHIFDDPEISPVYKINQASSLINSLSDNFYANVLGLIQSLSELMLEHGTDIDNFIKTLKSDFMHNINSDTSKA
jgi:hypothetical protein